MKAILLPSDPSKAIELINVPMIDGYVQVCNTMKWIISETLDITIKGQEFFLVRDYFSILDNSKFNIRASELYTHSKSKSNSFPIFGDVLLFVKCLNEFNNIDYCSCDEDYLILLRGILNE